MQSANVTDSTYYQFGDQGHGWYTDSENIVYFMEDRVVDSPQSDSLVFQHAISSYDDEAMLYNDNGCLQLVKARGGK